MEIKYRNQLIHYGCWLIIIYFVTSINCNKNKEDQLKSEVLPPCQSCKVLVQSFKKGIDRTSRYKFEGGDADWEEKKQIRYATSEIRLTEIQEELCRDIVKGQNQCHKLASENDENFEKWWVEEQKTHPDLYEWLCIQTLLACCPNNTYGANCDPCPGGTLKACNDRGVCKGAGTRTGSGSCKCNRGYTASDCSLCSIGFYNESITDDEFVCMECFRGCQGHCRDGSPKGCEVCASGWLNHPELGCQDIDECFNEVPVCNSDQFCVNTEGAYTCIDCHVSCASCEGDAPNECKTCKTGYTKRDNLCMDSKQWWLSIRSNSGHYLTYLGLCVATCIVLKKSLFLASVFGLIVALYIGMSEYTLANSSPGTVNILPTTQQP